MREETLARFLARVFQHEHDPLEGMAFLDPQRLSQKQSTHEADRSGKVKFVRPI
jgi:peptide deformylase